MKFRPILNRSFLFCFVCCVIVVLGFSGLLSCTKKPSPQPHAGLPDLVPQGVSFKTFKTDKGIGFLFVSTVKNQGPIDAPGSTTTVLFEGGSDGGKWSYGPVELTTFHLSAGTSDNTLETPVPLPNCIPLCFFTVEADSNHQVDESDENNNKQTGTIRCSPCRIG
jgi:D-alanyl-lipoteichoic acid acyltransferase DltB (MBOAT superfamily)